MNRPDIKPIKRILVTLFVLLLSCLTQLCIAQEVEPMETEMTLMSWQIDGQDLEFQVQISAVDTAGDYTDIHHGVINLYAVTPDTTLFLSQGLTNSKGKCVIIVPSVVQLPRGEGAMYSFQVEYDGNDNYGSISEEVSFRKIILKTEFETEDSLRYIYITATGTDSIGGEIPVKEAECLIKIKRMHSWLTVGTIDIEDGEGSFEFPLDIPGDSIGGLTIRLEIEDHDFYLNARTESYQEWGIAVDYSKKGHVRALWSDFAPIWMIIALLIVISGVWLNFFIAFLKLWKSFRIGRKIKT